MTVAPSAKQRKRPPFNWEYYLADNITGSWGQMLWIALLSLLTLLTVISQLRQRPVLTLIIVAIWLASVLLMFRAEIGHKHNGATAWLKDNLYSTVSNIILTLLIALFVASAAIGFFGYAVTNASFSTDADVAKAVTNAGDTGARWGAVIDNLANLLFFRMKGIVPADFEGGVASSLIYQVTRGEMYRFWLSLLAIIIMVVLSLIFLRGEKYRGKWQRQAVMLGWPYLFFQLFWFLRGFGSGGISERGLPMSSFRSVGFLYAALAVAVAIGIGYLNKRYLATRVGTVYSLLSILVGVFQYVVTPLLIVYFLSQHTGGGRFYALDVEAIWGGFLLTLIISVFAIVVSFPLGILLALGRRSETTGIPWWVTYPLTIIATIYLLFTSTRGLYTTAWHPVGKIVAFWPLLLLVAAYFFQRNLQGNVVAAFSTLYIECIRGVPLITLLFMSIVLFPIFLPPNVEVKGPWRVMAAFAMFSAAYLAENVRGGLQAIPKGQYEAADSLGLSTFNKYRMIVLPQALRLVIPAIVGQFIGLFKDTSLVYLVGLFDLLYYANSIGSQQKWLTIRTEPYIFLFILYFLGSGLMAWYSRRIEDQLAVGQL